MPATPECPRCGYDLSGQAAARTVGAHEGTCSECGLAVDWAAVLDQSARGSPGFFEHALRRHPAAFAMTLWRSFRPGRFWRWVRLEGSVAHDRLVMFAAAAPFAALAAAFLVVMLAVLVATGVQHLGPVWARLEYGELLSAAAWPDDVSDRESWGSMVLGGSMVAGGLVGVPLAPLLLLVLGDSLRLAKVKRVHLVRIAAYSVVSVAAVYLAAAALVIAKQLARRWNDPGGDWGTAAFSQIAGWVFEHSGLMLAPAIGALWTAWAVRCACRHYLRLPHAAGIAWAVWTAAALLSFIAGSVFYVVTRV